MVVDTSAIVAILFSEPNAGQMIEAIDKAEVIQMSAASVLEASLVVESRFGDIARKALDEWLDASSVEVIPVTRKHVEVARKGFRRFGKGRHKAALNFGDCFSYGLAMTLGEPLLFCGNDFALTDVRAAAPLIQ